MRYLKFLYFGPPRSGKSSTRRRLVKEIINLSSLGEQPISTGLAETNDVIIKKLTSETSGISGSQWWSMKRPNQGRLLGMYGQEDLAYFAHLFRRLISESKSNTVLATTVSELTSSIGKTESDKPRGLKDPNNIEAAIHSKRNNSPQLNDQNLVLINSATELKNGLPSTPLSYSEKEVNQAFDKLISILQSDSPEELRQLLEEITLINNVDVGGQPAFLELCPAFTIGPALYLIFFRLDQELRKNYEIKFVDADRKETILRSSYCTETVIHQSLSSIACFGSYSTAESATTSEASSHALLFGTHKDQVNSEAIILTDRILRQQLQGTKLDEKGLLLRGPRNEIFFSVDNMTGDESEMLPIREDIEKIISQFFPPVAIPASWIMFRVMLHLMQKPVVSLTQCEQIAKQVSMSEPVQKAIWFFHHQIGSLMHYPNIPSLKDVVICNLQVVFDSTGELIIDTFKISNRAIPARAVDDFHNKGLFSLSHIKDRTEQRRNNQLSLKQLVDLLKHHCILAEIKIDQENSESQSEPKFIMPAVLMSASEEELKVQTSTDTYQEASPLMIHFTNGFVPFGVFCASTASLIARQNSMSPIWQLCGKLIMKNKVTFIIDKAFRATLISRPQYIEVRVERVPQTRSSVESLSYICSTVQQTVVETLEKVISNMKYQSYAETETSLFSSEHLFNLAFACSLDDSHSDHLMIVTRDKKGRCGECLVENLNQNLKKCHSVWFKKVLSVIILLLHMYIHNTYSNNS